MAGDKKRPSAIGAWLRKTAERSNESPLRFLFFAAACLLGFLALVGFGLFNLINRHYVEAGLGLTTGTVPVLAFLFSLRATRREPVYFLGFLFVHLFRCSCWAEGSVPS